MGRARQILQLMIPPRGWIVPTSSTFRESLCKVEGVFEMSPRETTSIFLWTAVYIAPFGYLAGRLWNDFERTSSNSDMLFVCFCVAMMVLIALWLLPRMSVKYEFRAGTVSRIAGNGHVRWQEDLTSVPRVVLCQDNFGALITLRWPERRRTLLVPDSMAEAIDEAQATYNKSRQRTREG
jgi:hypothetical protein